jgi:hypothetical protein
MKDITKKYAKGRVISITTLKRIFTPESMPFRKSPSAGYQQSRIVDTRNKGAVSLEKEKYVERPQAQLASVADHQPINYWGCGPINSLNMPGRTLLTGLCYES